MSTSFDRLPEGSLVLVTGATGYIGSAVVDVLLDRGFQVRATTRSEAKAAAWQKHFANKFQSAQIEFVAFADYTSPEGYAKVLKDVDGVVYLATDTSFGSSYEQVVEQSAAASLAILRAAEQYPQIKSIVITSSIVAGFSLDDDEDLVLDQKSYNPVAEVAASIDPKDPSVGQALYAASKVESERQAWTFVRETAPKYSFNTVLPGFVAGPDFGPEPSASTGSWLKEFFEGNRNGFGAAFLGVGVPIVDIRDTAALHVAALLDTQTEGQRLWDMPHKVYVDDIMAAWREAFPDKTLGDGLPNVTRRHISVDESQSDRLIEGWQGGWTDWKKTVVDNVKAA